MAVSFGAGGAKLLKANHLAFFGRVYSTRMETASTHAIYVAAHAVVAAWRHKG